MAGQVFVVVHCVRTRRPMTGRFDEQHNGWKLAELHLREGPDITQAGEDPERLQGNFDVASEFTGCPECGNRSFVRCDCGELCCWPGGAGHYTCVVCGKAGNVFVRPVVEVHVDDFG
jgi:hypothetical protein